MTTRNQALAAKLHALGFDVFPLKQSKKPDVESWKVLPDFKELKFTNKNLIGIACGRRSNNLEVIDVDTKTLTDDLEIRASYEETFPTVLKEYFLENHQINICELVALYGTMSGGYHIIYKSEFLEPNQKIGVPFLEMAKDKNNKEALFETRGEGGFIVCYPDNNITGYLKLSELLPIGKSIRAALFDFALSLSTPAKKQRTPEPPPKINRPKVDGEDLIDTIRSTYTIEEVIRDDFQIFPPDNKGNKEVLRHGSKAQKSGSIFNTPHGQILYLHTSNAGDYPAEKSLDVIALIAIKNGCSYGDVLRGFIEELKSA